MNLVEKQTWIFLHLQLKNVKKFEADITYTIESTNSTLNRNFVFKFWDGAGRNICSIDEFFDPEKKYIIDGKFVLKVNGIFKFENDDFIEEQKWLGGELGNELWENDETKDFTIFAVDGNEIKVHKLILLTRSEFFKEMLNSCATESSVEITDFPFKVVETAFKIIYNCNFTSTLSMDELMELQQFFDKYLFSTFKARIEPYLINQISPSTVVHLTNCSILTTFSKLKEKCIEFLIDAFQSKTAIADIEILDKNICMKVLQNSLYRPLETE